MCIGAFNGQLDASIVTLALPRLGHDFHATLGTVSWVARRPGAAAAGVSAADATGAGAAAAGHALTATMVVLAALALSTGLGLAARSC